MARQYSPTQFFRRVPKPLLARFFQEKHGVLKELDFAWFKETDVGEIFQAFGALPVETQAKIEAECQDIDTMACQGGITALADEADFHKDTAFPQGISKVKGFHGKAMWAFLEHPAYWKGASMFLHSDGIRESLWKKRNDLPHLPAQVKIEDIEDFENAIAQFFYRKEGRGRNCKVEVFRRRNKEYFFAYPEDFAQSGVEWVRDSLSTQARHPAFEIIFVYCQTEGSLDIYAPRNTKYVSDLQQIFVETILKLDDLVTVAADSRVYNLNPLADRDFIFRYPPDTGIQTVGIRRLCLKPITGKRCKITLEVDPAHDPKAIYDLMDSLKLPKFIVSQAEIKVRFATTPETKCRTRSFTISYPNWCALRHDGRDQIIRQMLTASGIETIKPETSEDL